MSIMNLLPQGKMSPVMGVVLAILQANKRFVPLPNVFPVLDHVCTLLRGLHGNSSTPKSLLLTGPRGVGKTCLFNALNDEAVLETVRSKYPSSNGSAAEVKPITMVKSADLSIRTPSDDSTFEEWAIHQVLERIEDDSQRQTAVTLLRQVLVTLTEARQQKEIYDVSRIRPPLRSILDKTGIVVPGLSKATSTLGVVSAIMKYWQIAALFLIDEAENLFKETNFALGTAEAWKAQLLSCLGISNSALGVVVCSSFQRASQLFLKRSEGHLLPKAYTYGHLSDDWNGDKLPHMRMVQPEWSRELLAHFIWGHWCQVKEANTEALRNKEAARMNAFFIGSDCEDNASTLKCLDASLEQFLRLYGHTPRRIARALEESLRSWQPLCPWPVPVSHAHHEEADLTTKQHEMARHALSEYMSLLGTKWDNPAHLGFTAEKFGVSRETLEARIKQGYTTAIATAQAAGGCELGDHTRPVTPTDYVDAAIDAGMLMFHSRGYVCIADPSVNVERVCSQNVCQTAISWLVHKGYGEEAEILVARNLARSRVPFMGETDVLAIANVADKVTVTASNPDCTCPSMASVHLVALTDDAAATATPLAATAVRPDDVYDIFGQSGVDTVQSCRQAAARARKAHLAAIKEHEAALEAKTVGKRGEKRAANNRLRDAVKKLQVTLGSMTDLVAPQSTWDELLRVEQAHNMDSESLAAYISVRRTSTAVRDKVKSVLLNGRGVWVKEGPDALGGDLLGIFPRRDTSSFNVRLVRIQVKMATQATLRQENTDVGDKAVKQALKKLLDPGTAPLQMDRASAGVRHLPSMAAVERFVHGLFVAEDTGPDAWHERYTALARSSRLTFTHVDPHVVTTHSVSQAVRDACQTAGVVLLEAGDLAAGWGELGDACKTLGVLPFARNPGLQPSDISVEQLSADLRALVLGEPQDSE